MRALMLFLCLCTALFAQATVDVTWMDGTTTTLTEGQTKNVRKCELTFTDMYFRLLNKGNPDPTPSQTPPPEPEFISALTFKLAADECIPLGSFIGAIDKGGGVWEVVRPGDWKQAAAYPVTNFAQYAPCANFHVIEGGKSLYVEKAKRSDPWRIAERSPTPQDRADAIKIFSPNWELLVRQQPFFQHYFGTLKKYNDDSLRMNIPAGRHNSGYLLNPHGFAQRWAATYSVASKANLWMFGTTEAGVSNRLEFYDADAAWMLAGLLTNDDTALLAGYHLYMYKVAHGFLDTDNAASTKRWRWAGEHSIGGLLGAADSKQWDLSTAIFDTLWPNHPIGRPVFLKRVAKNRNYLFWGGNGGGRECGNKIKNAWYMWQSSGDDVIRDRACWEIDEVFRVIIKDKDFLEDNKGTGVCWPGESMPVFLKFVYHWYLDGGIGSISLSGQNGMANWNGQTFDQRNPGFAAKLDRMLTWMCTYGGVWVDAPAMTKWNAGYRVNSCTNISGIPQIQGNLQGIFWMGLEKRATTAFQKKVIGAVEKHTFTSTGAYYQNPMTLLGSDYGGQGPGWCKWIEGIVAASALN